MRAEPDLLFREGFGENHRPNRTNIFGIMVVPRVTLCGGNCNNGSNCGSRYVNVNNTATSSYWNIGASPVTFML